MRPCRAPYRLSPAQLRVISKCKYAKESLALVGLQLRRLVGFRPQPVASVQLEHCAQVDGVVPAVSHSVAVLLSRVLARRPHRAHQRGVAADGLGEAQDPVAEGRAVLPGSLLVGVAAGDSEGRLAVDEVQAGFRDDDLVVLQLEAALSERLALTVLPLQLARHTLSFVVASWKKQEEKSCYSLETLRFLFPQGVNTEVDDKQLCYQGSGMTAGLKPMSNYCNNFPIVLLTNMILKQKPKLENYTSGRKSLKGSFES